MQVGLSGYASGKTLFFSLIDGQRTLKNMQIDYYKAIVDYERGLADLRMAVGDDLRTPAKEGSNEKK